MQTPYFDGTILAGRGDAGAVRLDVDAEDGGGGSAAAVPQPVGEEKVHGERTEDSGRGVAWRKDD